MKIKIGLSSKTVLCYFWPFGPYEVHNHLENFYEETCTGYSLMAPSDSLATLLHRALSPWGCPPDGQHPLGPFILVQPMRVSGRRTKSKKRNRYFPPGLSCGQAQVSSASFSMEASPKAPAPALSGFWPQLAAVYPLLFQMHGCMKLLSFDSLGSFTSAPPLGFLVSLSFV